jgi:hypothetical protein
MRRIKADMMALNPTLPDWKQQMQPMRSAPVPLIRALVPEAPFAVADALLAAPETARRRLAEDGYLFLRGVVDREALAGVRRDILGLCSDHGWLDPEAPPMAGVYRGGPFPDHTSYMELYRGLIRLPSFNRLAESPSMLALFASLLDGPVLAHRRNIARIAYPGNVGGATQPHQDHFYIRGSAETYTAWIPTADCPCELGSLAILERSHRLGFLPHEPTIGAGGHGVRTQGLGLRWVGGDFRAGDLLLFHSHTIHAALDNRTRDRLRVSLDYRYQRADADIDPSSLEPHGG